MQFSANIIEFIIKRHQGKPLYAAFLEHHVRELALPLRDVEVRKVASGLTTLANEKQREQRDKASGKKKPKAVAKPALGLNKPSSKYVVAIGFQRISLITFFFIRLDTTAYEEALDDFDDNGDFM